MKEAITIAKQEFYNELQSFGTDPYDLNSHVNEMENGEFLCAIIFQKQIGK